jgi:type VI secretion system protein ImpE
MGVSAAEELLRSGQLTEALSRLQEQVRKEPANARLRVFLFQLLAVVGQWERALNQLQVAGQLDASTLAMVAMYREAVRCEALRQKVFAGERSPVFFGEPEEWMALLVEALRLEVRGQIAESRSVRDRAFAAAATMPGTINGEPFEWVADADPRLGPILEAVVNGSYYWVPFGRLRSVAVDPPEDLRDAVWMPAHFTWANGGESVGLIPTRYPGSEASEDPQIRLAHRTEWVERGPDLFLGLGQRMLATDAAEYPIMDLRRLTLGP